MIKAHAPGKLVIVGEYAVLHGAPALAVAVDARVRVHIEGLAGATGELITGSGESAPFSWHADGTVNWLAEPPGPNGRPLQAVLATLGSAGLLSRSGELPAARISISSSEFQQPGAPGQPPVKLGLGSSAAVIVALLAALLRHLSVKLPGQASLLELCMEAHRRLQGGMGSGIDVAASLLGGVIAREAGAQDQARPQIQPVAWPRGLQLLALWTGQGASTTDLLRRFESWQLHAPQAFAAQLERLQTVAVVCLAGWRANDSGKLLSALRNYDEALRQLDEAAGIGIYTPAHERLRMLSHEHGLVYKPSGAGGGDFGIALGTDRAAMAALAVAAAAAGYRPLELPLCAPGLAASG